MKRKNFRPKKHLGQNFLYDPAIAEKILAATSLQPGHTVVELGPGKGILTKALAARGVRLIAIEVDRTLIAELEEHFAEVSDELPGETPEIVNADLSKVRLGELLSERGIDSCTLVGNIPYYLTRDVLFDYLVAENECIDAAYIMMQKEVGDRIVSAPGNRIYGIPSVILQTLYDVRTVTKVAPGSFSPPPKVASIVLEFKPVEQPLIAAQELPELVKLVKNVFQQRRKTIASTLRSFYGFDEKELVAIHSSTGIDLQSRPEMLSNELFVKLSRRVAEVSSN